MNEESGYYLVPEADTEDLQHYNAAVFAPPEHSLDGYMGSVGIGEGHIKRAIQTISWPLRRALIFAPWALEMGGHSGSKRLREDDSDEVRASHRALEERHLEAIQRNENLLRQIDTLRSQNQVIQARSDSSQIRIIELESQISNLEQGQDFRSVQGVSGPAHGRIQTELGSVRRSLRNWVLNTFGSLRSSTGTVETFPFDDYQEFYHYLDRIRNKNVDFSRYSALNITVLDLIEAVVADIIVREVILEPLNGCNPVFKAEVENSIYHQIAQDESREAKSWQTTCLQAYHMKSEWRPYFDTPDKKEMYRKSFRQYTCKTILSVLGRIAENYCGNAPDEGALDEVVRKALDLSIDLGVLRSGLEVMDPQWLESKDWKYISSDNRMELRHSPDEGNCVEGKIAIVLFPGLLKKGRDNGESWGSWSVWTCLRVEAVDLHRVQNRDKLATTREVAHRGLLPRAEPQRSTSSKQQRMLEAPSRDQPHNGYEQGQGPGERVHIQHWGAGW